MSNLKSYNAVVYGVPSQEELNIFREWFHIATDFNPQYLESKDYELARKIYTILDARWPDRYENELNMLKSVGR